MPVRFLLKEVMARREVETNRKVTYYSISQDTGISTSTLSNLANNKIKMVGLSVLDRLCEHFNVPVERLMLYIPNKHGGDGGGKGDDTS